MKYEYNLFGVVIQLFEPKTQPHAVLCKRAQNYINHEVENKSRIKRPPCLMSLKGGQEKTKKKSFTWLVDFSFRPHQIHLG